MGTVQQLAENVKEGLQAAHPKLRKTVLNPRALAVGAMLAAPTPNPSELANRLRCRLSNRASATQGYGGG